MASLNASTEDFDVFGALVAGPGILDDLRIEVAIAIHRFLEYLDRARQPANLVGAFGVGDLDVFVAFGDALDGGCDDRQWARDRTRDDQHADHDHDHRQHAETGQDEGHGVVGVGLLRQLLAAFGINLGERLEILVQRRAHFAVGVIVAPFAAGGGTDLDAAANQLFPEVDELFDALLEGAELLGVIGLDDGFPVLDDGENPFIELEQPVAVLLHDGRIRRHVDAAGFHHDRIDQRIDPFDVQRRAAGGVDRFHQFCIATGVVIGQSGDGGSEQREQRKDRIKPGRE